MQRFFLMMQMLPSIMQTVKDVEALIPQKSQGANKLNLVLATTQAAIQSVPEMAVAFAGHDIQSSIGAIVGVAVTSMNAAGVFNKP